MNAPSFVPLDSSGPGLAGCAARLLAPDAVGLLGLRHALAQRLPGFWGDAPHAPRSLLFLRASDGGALEAFGLGVSQPAVSWLAAQPYAVALAAPRPWLPQAAARVRGGWYGTVVTCVASQRVPTRPAPSRVAVRPLTPDDEPAFAASAPAWALRGWTTFDALMARGAAFGVVCGDAFASLAWILEMSERYDSIAVYTVPRFRRLGLAWASAAALLDHVRGPRRKVALWSAAADNGASLALAASLGFVPRASETILRWPAPTLAEVVTHGAGIP